MKILIFIIIMNAFFCGLLIGKPDLLSIFIFVLNLGSLFINTDVVLSIINATSAEKG